MKRFFAALRFLTILPVPDRWSGNEQALARSVPFFPLVGLVIGFLAAGLDYVFVSALPLLPASALTILVLICLTGGLHMDGLADTADGFFSARPRSKMMEIMRDSRIGVMGVLAVVFVVLLKVTLLAAMVAPSRWVLILLMPLAGRAAVILLMTALPYARPEGGLATLFAGGRPWLPCLWSCGLLFALSIWLAQGVGLAAALLALAFSALFALYNHKKIGGYTGDTLGAVCEVAEMAPLLVAVIYASISR
jgi:adenosylcobinamide-GDP ribazoletransferase